MSAPLALSGPQSQRAIAEPAEVAFTMGDAPGRGVVRPDTVDAHRGPRWRAPQTNRHPGAAGALWNDRLAQDSVLQSEAIAMLTETARPACIPAPEPARLEGIRTTP